MYKVLEYGMGGERAMEQFINKVCRSESLELVCVDGRYYVFRPTQDEKDLEIEFLRNLLHDEFNVAHAEIDAEFEVWRKARNDSNG